MISSKTPRIPVSYTHLDVYKRQVAILDKVKGEKQREWYIRKTAENGWSHNVLIHQIESGLYERQAMPIKILVYISIDESYRNLVLNRPLK